MSEVIKCPCGCTFSCGADLVAHQKAFREIRVERHSREEEMRDHVRVWKEAVRRRL